MISFLIGTAAGLNSALGLGSGTVLIICLTLRGIDRLTASGINLLFFPLTGGFSLWLHHRHGLVRWRTALPFILFGCLGSLLGSWTAGVLPQQWLNRCFGGLLIGMGLWELVSCLKKTAFLHNPADKGTK